MVPFRNTFSHQFREDSHCGKPMKYKAAHRTLRIKEILDRQELNYMPNSLNSSLSKAVDKAEKKSPKAVDKLNKQIYRGILPSLHEKSCFSSRCDGRYFSSYVANDSDP